MMEIETPDTTTVNLILDKLQKKGVRMTKQREAVLRAIATSHTHPTVEELYTQLKPYYPSMSLATVYNNLKVFLDHHVMTELNTGTNTARYDMYTHGQHYHAICTECGKIVDFNFPPLTDAEMVAEAVTGFKIKEHNLEVRGLCPECYEKAKMSGKEA